MKEEKIADVETNDYSMPSDLRTAGRRLLTYAIQETMAGTPSQAILLGIVAEVAVWSQAPPRRAKSMYREGVA